MQTTNMSMLSSFRTWLSRKQVQIEVTFSVYMFTPWEKFAFYSIVFLLLSLTLIASLLYLPHHVAILAGRAWYYINGENIDVAASAREVVKDMTSSVLHEKAAPTIVTMEAVETIVKEL